MPGMENLAPERTETSSGSAGSPSRRPIVRSSAARCSSISLASPSTCSPVGEVALAGLGGDGETGGTGRPRFGHFGEVGALAAEQILQVLVALGEVVDELLAATCPPSERTSGFDCPDQSVLPGILKAAKGIFSRRNCMTHGQIRTAVRFSGARNALPSSTNAQHSAVSWRIGHHCGESPKDIACSRSTMHPFGPGARRPLPALCTGSREISARGPRAEDGAPGRHPVRRLRRRGPRPAPGHMPTEMLGLDRPRRLGRASAALRLLFTACSR